MYAEEAAMGANDEEIEIKHEPLESDVEEDVSIFKLWYCLKSTWQFLQRF